MQSITDNSPNHLGCEALDCNAAATTGLQLKAGKGRSILLHLCNDCTRRFKEISKTLDQWLPQRPESRESQYSIRESLTNIETIHVDQKGEKALLQWSEE